MRKLSALLFVATFLFAAQSAFGQGIDFAFGLGTVRSAGNSNPNGNPQSLSGSVYPAISGDFLIHKNFGVQGEVAWKGGRGDYGGLGLPYRPVIWDFNALYAPKVNRIGGELMAGIGALSSRFYTGQYSCSGITGSCTNYQSSNHFAVHLGGGLRLYVTKSIFVRPEIGYYFARNANVDFTSNSFVRVGASVGFSLGGH